MAYQCRQCNRVGSEAGACPVCNIPMDIRLQDMQPDMVPAEEPTTEVAAPVVEPMEAPEVAPEAPVEEKEKEVPAEGGDEAVV